MARPAQCRVPRKSVGINRKLRIHATRQDFSAGPGSAPALPEPGTADRTVAGYRPTCRIYISRHAPCAEPSVLKPIQIDRVAARHRSMKTIFQKNNSKSNSIIFTKRAHFRDSRFQNLSIADIRIFFHGAFCSRLCPDTGKTPPSPRFGALALLISVGR